MKKQKAHWLAFTLLLSLVANAQSFSPADAMALEQQGRLGEAEDAWQSVVRQNPGDSAAFASLGVVLSKEQKFGEASIAYRKALVLNPQLPGVRLNLGLAEFKQGHFDAAIAPLRAVLHSDPKNMQARTLLGLSYYGAQRFQEAVACLQPAAESDSANTELQRVLAQSCLLAKKYSCAVAEFRRILQQNPDSPAAHLLMGEALDGLGRTLDAIAEFKEAEKAGPREPNVHFGLGYLYWKSHQYDQAKPEFESELSLDPGHAQSMAYLGDIEMKRNDPAEALTLLKKAVELNREIRIAYLDLGAILTEQKQYPEGIAALEQAEKLDATEPDAHFRLARAYQAMGRSADAKREFAKVRELHQKTGDDVASKMSSSPTSLPPAPAK
jgi:tetratricopeptide (TPR) repeat protein